LRLAKEESARMLREQIARAALLCSGLQERKILLDRNRKLAGERFRVAEAAIRIG